MRCEEVGVEGRVKGEGEGWGVSDRVMSHATSFFSQATYFSAVIIPPHPLTHDLDSPGMYSKLNYDVIVIRLPYRH